MPLRNENESMRFRARLESQTPLPSGADAERLREQIQEDVREAERRDSSKSEELVSTVLDCVARDFFRHHAQKKRPRTLASGQLTRTNAMAVMFDKCQELDLKISRYLYILERVLDPLLAEGVGKLIEEAEAEKAALHSEQQK